MASLQFFFILFFLLAVYTCYAFLDDLVDDTDGCTRMCSNSYPLHTYEKAAHKLYCYRGCRLFSIIDLLDDGKHYNLTRDSCASACKEAYMDKNDMNACVLGCDSQLSVIKNHKITETEDSFTDEVNNAISPFLYVHNFYTNMVGSVCDHMSMTWSFFVSNDDGTMLVMRSQPHYLAYSQLPEKWEDSKTSNYVEPFLPEVDNSATPNVKHSQMHPIDIMGGSYDSVSTATIQEVPSDWLSCIAKKTGLPRLLLSFTIFASAMVMIWLCFTTAVTAPDQKVKSEKLSINGDLEYLTMFNKKDHLMTIHPQDMIHQASPLPVKIKLEDV